MAAVVELVTKWEGRAREWRFLAECAMTDHVKATCESLAQQADTMARFWSK